MSGWLKSSLPDSIVGSATQATSGVGAPTAAWIWPAIDIAASGTRREELLLDPKELDLVVRLRKVVSDMSVVEAMELLRGRLGKTKSNAEFLMTMNLG